MKPRPPKRKAETKPPIVDEPPEKKRDPTIKNKPAEKFDHLPPRYHGKLSPRMLACKKILEDFRAKRSHHVSFLINYR